MGSTRAGARAGGDGVSARCTHATGAACAVTRVRLRARGRVKHGGARTDSMYGARVRLCALRAGSTGGARMRLRARGRVALEQARWLDAACARLCARRRVGARRCAQARWMVHSCSLAYEGRAALHMQARWRARGCAHAGASSRVVRAQARRMARVHGRAQAGRTVVVAMRRKMWVTFKKASCASL
eukprot:2816331-Pleurochrysis_carterae.AAC.4